MAMSSRSSTLHYPLRVRIVLCFFIVCAAGLVWRSIDLQLLNHEFLTDHGDARSIRNVSTPAYRGLITDRNGEYLAISTSVESIWAKPKDLITEGERLADLAEILGIEVRELKKKLEARSHKDFIYLKRHANPDITKRVMSLELSGVYLEKEYKRYYPEGEIPSHVIGFTNIDDVGQEGVELIYNDWLHGQPGKKQVLKDRLGRVVEHVRSIQNAQPGKDLVLSIDKRIQYLAYRHLQRAVQTHKALSGSLIVLDVHTGEVLGMVNQPSYNPNDRRQLRDGLYRNRAVTDTFEPGSAMKPFTVIAALSSKMYQPTSMIDTRPGYIQVDKHLIRDAKNYGIIDLSAVIKKSSNVGMTKVALSLDVETLWTVLRDVGFGQLTGSFFPGDVSGRLMHYEDWSKVDLAAVSYGYGISVNLLQLVRAYAAIAGGGVLKPISFVKVDQPPSGKLIFSPAIAAQVKDMLEQAVSPGGTGTRAKVSDYRVAGKTGTVRKSIQGGYSDSDYLSVFVGFAPVTSPRIAIAVIIDEPSSDTYYGGTVAAPVFASVMEKVLRVMRVSPDNINGEYEQTIAGIDIGAE